MDRYIITCDIPADTERYDKVLQALSKCGSFTRVTDSTWLVATRLPTRELFLRLRMHTHAQDTLYLLRFDDALEGFGPRRINQWIELTENQPRAANG
ncbi:hypothetical protein [Halotalea alkalilenta]|uniref:Uncharacterized protein n=1 Tax=Halotalea alkalilenta TaxID=376489 RepID=A0A172YCI4_9GAMM|nr:hypothetical protein [Halotalea alkalilenta]ANF56960.1 hypothetical protein A5892_05340 [Halotalea alkalilenta]